MADDDVLDNGPDDDDDDGVGMDLDRPSTGRARNQRDEPDDDDDDADDDTDATDANKDSAAKDKPKDEQPAGKTYSQVDIDALKDTLRKEREAKRDLSRQLREAKKAKEPAPDTEDAVAKARAEGQDEMKMVAVAAKAEALLVKAKLQNPTDARVARLIKQINLDEIDVDPKSGAIDGLEDQVDALVEEYPELFAPPKKEAADDDPPPAKKRIPRGDGSDRRPGRGQEERKLSTGERIERDLRLGVRR